MKTNLVKMIFISLTVDLIMDVVVFVAVDVRVTVVMVGLVGVGGFVLTAVAEKYFSA